MIKDPFRDNPRPTHSYVLKKGTVLKSNDEGPDVILEHDMRLGFLTMIHYPGTTGNLIQYIPNMETYVVDGDNCICEVNNGR